VITSGAEIVILELGVEFVWWHQWCFELAHSWSISLGDAPARPGAVDGAFRRFPVYGLPVLMGAQRMGCCGMMKIYASSTVVKTPLVNAAKPALLHQGIKRPAAHLTSPCRRASEAMKRVEGGRRCFPKTAPPTVS